MLPRLGLLLRLILYSSVLWCHKLIIFDIPSRNRTVKIQMFKFYSLIARHRKSLWHNHYRFRIFPTHVLNLTQKHDTWTSDCSAYACIDYFCWISSKIVWHIRLSARRRPLCWLNNAFYSLQQLILIENQHCCLQLLLKMHINFFVRKCLKRSDHRQTIGKK